MPFFDMELPELNSQWLGDGGCCGSNQALVQDVTEETLGLAILSSTFIKVICPICSLLNFYLPV